MAKRVITARSAAHERLPSSSPCDETKRVQRRPHSRAFSFISRTNLRSLPDTCTASAIDASLPDTSIAPLSSDSSRTRLPFGSTPTPEPW